MKSRVLLASLVLMLLSVGVVSAATNWGKFEGFNIIKLVINGKEAKVQDVPAVMLNGRTMVPIYMLREAGLSVSWDGEKSTVNVISNQPATTGFDSVQSTKKIISYGGAGLTLTNVSNSLTSIVYFEKKKGFDQDWDSIFNIFVELMNYDTAYARVVYGVSGVEQGYVEIDNRTLKSYLNGNISEEMLLKSWVLTGSLLTNQGNKSSESISYPELYSNDLKVFLGKLTTNEFDSDSVFNTYGTYGSMYSTNSIWNSYGVYGSDYSNTSAFNKYATTPPVIIKNDKIIGFVTANTTLQNGIHPDKLKSYLEELGY